MSRGEFPHRGTTVDRATFVPQYISSAHSSEKSDKDGVTRNAQSTWDWNNAWLYASWDLDDPNLGDGFINCINDIAAITSDDVYCAYWVKLDWTFQTGWQFDHIHQRHAKILPANPVRCTRTARRT
jgi:hypothetical protein